MTGRHVRPGHARLRSTASITSLNSLIDSDDEDHGERDGLIKDDQHDGNGYNRTDQHQSTEYTDSLPALNSYPPRNVPATPQKPGPPIGAGAVTWLSLPAKSQLAILFCCRLFDFLQITALQAYLFYQLQSFDPSLPEATISYQAGILQGAFTASQFATAIAWGRVADAGWGGRKRVLLIGLVGTGVSCIGSGFSRSFGWAVAWRAFGGGINGTVGIM
jgi:hypothetical protein